jgi:hypothetical protein
MTETTSFLATFVGTIHGLVMLNAIAERPAARGAMTKAINSLRNALD